MNFLKGLSLPDLTIIPNTFEIRINGVISGIVCIAFILDFFDKTAGVNLS